MIMEQNLKNDKQKTYALYPKHTGYLPTQTYRRRGGLDLPLSLVRTLKALKKKIKQTILTLVIQSRSYISIPLVTWGGG